MIERLEISQPTESAWRRRLSRYWALCKVSFQSRMEYRWNNLFYLTMTLIPTLVSIYLWNAVYGSNNPAAVRYITTYYVVAAYVGWRVAEFHWEIMWEIREGRMATDLMRPLSYPAKTFWYEVGGRTWSTILTTPAFVLLAFALGSNFQLPPDGINWLLAILSFCLSFGLSFYMTAALGLLTVWQNQPEAFFALWGAVARILGGVFVPLALLPWGLGEWLQWLPFAYIYTLPVRLYQGLDPAHIWQGFTVQIGWLLISALVFRWVWRKAVRRYEVFEG